MRAEPCTAPDLAPVRRAAACFIAAVGALAALAPGVAAHGHENLPDSAAAEQRLRAYETATLGAAHAAEHAHQRALERAARRRWLRLTPRQRLRVQARERAEQRALEQAAGPPAQVGAWTTAPFRLPNFGVHAIVLPTGKVLLFSAPSKSAGPPLPNRALATVWNPALGTGPQAFHNVPPPLVDDDGDGIPNPAPIYCSGHSLLPNGAVIVAGGNLVWPSIDGDAYTDYAGVDHLFTFDPWRETWQTQPRMRHGRWYPTVIELASGRTLILGGWSDQPPGGIPNLEAEVFVGPGERSGVGHLDYHPTANRSVEEPYARLLTLPNRDVLLAGPEDVDSAVLDPHTFTWRDIPDASRTRLGSNAVLLPSGPGGPTAVAQVGGYDPEVVDGDGVEPPTETTETLNLAHMGRGWRPGPPMNLARDYQNTVLLPDGSMVAVGGGAGFGPKIGAFHVDPEGKLRQVELYDPKSESWRLGPPQREDRAYHSTAVLLPSGRVLSSGDDYNPPVNDNYSTFDTGEIYSPPYLFRGRRPRIAFAPRSVRWGDVFGVRSRGRVARAVLMAPSSTTHAVDMSQRRVELRVTKRFGRRGANLRAPAGAGVAPPGYYMLFLLNGKGVPSRARWVRISGRAPMRRTLRASRVG